MIITLSIKLTPETRQEMISTYPTSYANLRQHVETMIASGSFGDPARIRGPLAVGQWPLGRPPRA